MIVYFTEIKFKLEVKSLTFDAASKHTKPMLKSMVSPMRWLSTMQAYVLHWNRRRLALLIRHQANWQTQTTPSLKCLIRMISVVHNYFGRQINKRFFCSVLWREALSGFAALVWFGGINWQRFYLRHYVFWMWNSSKKLYDIVLLEYGI